MHSLSACIVNTDVCNRDFGVGEQDMEMVLSVQERGTFGCADRFVGHGHFAQGLAFVVVGGCAGGRDEFVGVIAVVCPTVIHGIFIRIEGIGEFESIAIGVGMTMGDGCSFEWG